MGFHQQTLDGWWQPWGMSKSKRVPMAALERSACLAAKTRDFSTYFKQHLHVSQSYFQWIGLREQSAGNHRCSHEIRTRTDPLKLAWLVYHPFLRKNIWAVATKSLYHSIILVVFFYGFLYWMILIPNILGSRIPEPIINQPSFIGQNIHNKNPPILMVQPL